MALTPEEELELAELNKAAGVSTVSASGLTPEEEEELRQLNAAAGVPTVAPKKEPEKGDLDESEIQDIADASGVSVDWIKEKIPYLAGFTGGYTKEQGMFEQLPQRALGEIGKQVLLGIPQKAYILAQDDKEQKALDMTRELIQAKRTTAQQVAEFGTGLILPGGVIAKGAKTAIGKVAGAAATGATYGVTGASTGKEVEGGIVGGTIGAALGGAVVAVPAAIKGFKNLTGKTQEEAAQFAKLNEVEAKAEKIIQDNSADIQERAKIFSTPESVTKMQSTYRNTVKQLKEVQDSYLKERPIGKQKEDAEALIKKLSDTIDSQEKTIQEAREFAGHLEGSRKALPEKEAFTVLRDATRREAEFVEKEYANFRKIKAFEEVQQSTLAARIPKERSFITRFKEMVYDGTIMARGIDRVVAGSDMTTVLDKMARNKRLFDTQVAAKLQKSIDLKKVVDDTGIDNDTAYKILDTVDVLQKGGKEQVLKMGLNETQADALIAYRNSFAELLSEAEKLGLKIDARNAYVPHLRVSTPETIRRIMKQAEAAGIDAEDARNTPGIDKLISEYSSLYRKYLTTDPLLRFEVKNGKKVPLEKPKGLDEFVKNNEAFVNTIRALEYIRGEKIDDAFSLGVALRGSQSPQLLNRLAQTEAKRAMQRTMDMPDFIREKNLSKLYLNWATDTFKHVYFREGLGELKVIRDLAVASNNRSAADYVERLRQDLTGLRDGTGLEWTRRATQKFQLTMKMLADKAPQNSYKQSLYETLGETPEMFGIIAAQVYPNFLGFSAKAVLANLTSPLTMALPELGGAYGMRKLLAAGLRGANATRAGRTIRIKDEMANYLNSKKYGGRTDYKAGDEVRFSGMDALSMVAKNDGYMGPQYSSELFRVVEGGIKDNAYYNMGMNAIEKYNTVAMYAFEKSETAIRTLMSDVADSVAIDLVKGNKSAQKFLGKMDRAYQIKVQKALQAGKNEEVTSLVKDYLIGRTLFNYDRISMSEFGRSMGPLFSVFSKWPSTIAADVMDKFDEKGIKKGGKEVFVKYMAPLAFLYMMDKMADGLDVSPEKSDLAYRLIGKEGFTAMAPINSINPLLEGTMVKPPVIEAMAGGIMALSKADPEALWKWANKTGQAFIPGSGMLRFLIEDLPVWMGEDRVEGPFAEKVYKRVTGER